MSILPDSKGNFTTELRINECLNTKRVLLTNVQVLDEVSQSTGCFVECKGIYMSQRQLVALQGSTTLTEEKPLYLALRANSGSSVAAACALIQNLIDEPSEILEDRFFVPITNDPPGFNLRGRLCGPGNQNFKFINRATAGTKVALRGRTPSELKSAQMQQGGVLDLAGTDRLHFFYIAPCRIMLEKAKKLSRSLCQKTAADLDQFRIETAKRKQREQELASREKLKKAAEARRELEQSKGHGRRESAIARMYAMYNEWKPKSSSECTYTPNPDFDLDEFASYPSNQAVWRNRRSPSPPIGARAPVRRLSPFRVSSDLQAAPVPTASEIAKMRRALRGGDTPLVAPSQPIRRASPARGKESRRTPPPRSMYNGPPPPSIPRGPAQGGEEFRQRRGDRDRDRRRMLDDIFS